MPDRLRLALRASCEGRRGAKTSTLKSPWLEKASRKELGRFERSPTCAQSWRAFMCIFVRVPTALELVFVLALRGASTGPRAQHPLRQLLCFDAACKAVQRRIEASQRTLSVMIRPDSPFLESDQLRTPSRWRSSRNSSTPCAAGSKPCDVR